MPVLDPDQFDPTRQLVMGRFGTLNRHPMTMGEPVTIVTADPKLKGEVQLEDAKRLWSRGTLVYVEDARPTPVETPEKAAQRLVEVDDLGDDKFMIRAPWLAEAEFFTGKEATTARYLELLAAGDPRGGPSVATVAVEGPATGQTTGTVAIDPAEAAAAIDGLFVPVEAGSNGWYEITGPGLDEPLRVRGKDAAETKAAELRDQMRAAAGGATEA